ncbi:MAG: hypothetical protein WA977_08530 [Halobacteriota archaeon]
MIIGEALAKIHSVKKLMDIHDILKAMHPLHAERLYLVGFLKYVGYSINEVCDLIDQFAEWEDYSQSATQYQVSTVFKQPHRTGSKTDSKSRARKWDLLPTEEYRIKLARSAESHRELEKWMQENDVPVCDAAPELDFDPTKMEQEK